MSAAKSLAGLKKNITGTVRYNDIPFTYTIYPNPHKKTEEEREYLINLFGNRIQKGLPCLNITPELVKHNIENRNYTALIHIKNDLVNDSVTGSIQYWNWCGGDASNKQLWINDLCRINKSNVSSSDLVSPTRILFDIVKDLSLKKNVNTNYLMVETGKSGTEKLLEVYGGYGFKKDDTCVLDGYHIMKKNLTNSGGRRNKTRKNT